MRDGGKVLLHAALTIAIAVYESSALQLENRKSRSERITDWLSRALTDESPFPQ
jgi:hypothetical protein